MKVLRIILETTEGEAEAIRDPEEDDRWTLNTPWSSSFFYGTFAQARKELRRKVENGEG